MSPVVSYVDKPDTGYLMNSPLLFEALQNLSQAGYFQLLDTMSASPSLLEVFSPYHCKLFLPGCLEELMRLRVSEDESPKKLSRALRRALCLHGDKGVKLDMLLLWDLPNYLTNPILSELIKFILPFTNQIASIHCYIYTSQNMPDTPSRYQFTTSDKIWVEPQSARTMTAPVHYQEALHKLLAPFVVRRSILLSNGLQEYVLRKKSC